MKHYKLAIDILVFLVIVHLQCVLHEAKLEEDQEKSFFTSEGSGIVSLKQKCSSTPYFESDTSIFQIDLKFFNITTSLNHLNVRVLDSDSLEFYPSLALIFRSPPRNLTGEYGGFILLLCKDPRFDLYGYSEGSIKVQFDVNFALSIKLELVYRFFKFSTCIDDIPLFAKLELIDEPSGKVVEVVHPRTENHLLKVMFKSTTIELPEIVALDVCILTVRKRHAIWKENVNKTTKRLLNFRLPNFESKKSFFTNKNNDVDVDEDDDTPFDSEHQYIVNSNIWKSESFSAILFRASYVASAFHFNFFDPDGFEVDDEKDQVRLEISLMVSKDFAAQALLSSLIIFALNASICAIVYILCPGTLLLLFLFYGGFHRFSMKYVDQRPLIIDEGLL